MDAINGKVLKRPKIKITSVWLIFFIFLAVFILLSIAAPGFFRGRNFITILRYSSFSGLIAIGMTFVMIGGGIDLSVGSILGLVSMILAYAMPESGGMWTMLLLGLGVGLICGAFNGAVVSSLKLPPFVITIGSSQAFKGLAHLIYNSPTKTFSNDDFGLLGKYDLFDAIPLSFLIMLGVAVISALVLKYTIFGRKVYAIGSNASASRLAGISSQKVGFWTYLISGLLSGLAGVIVTSQNGSGIATAGLNSEMDAIAAVVLGGGSLSGGKGGIVGTLIAVLLLKMISNGMNLMNVQTYWQMVVQGALLIIAVIVDSLKNNTKE